MATDAHILSAARELARCMEAIRKADDAKKLADLAQLRAAQHSEDCRKRANEARTWLIQAGEKAGPEPEVKPVVLTPTPVEKVAAVLHDGQPLGKPKKVPELPALQLKKAGPMTWADNRPK